MFAKTFLIVTAMAATSLGTNLHVDVGCIMVGGTHKLCADDGAYSINGNTAQILSDYGDVYWNKDDCLVDAEGYTIQCAD
ncbi:Ff.00g077880.m01.CDS01 [Fusarium sp. VM40]|nr:Ff.00g077880.m01.CDS01 [Fusarium sp. VM40]